MAICGGGLRLFGCRDVEEIGTLSHHLYEFAAAELEVNLGILL